MSKSWQIYRSRVIERVIVYSLIFGLGYAIAIWEPVNCEVDRVETRVKI
jgi:hypothetical protein